MEQGSDNFNLAAELIPQASNALVQDWDNILVQALAFQSSACLLTFKGVCSSSETLPNNPETGDVFRLDDTQGMVVWTGTYWAPVIDSVQIDKSKWQWCITPEMGPMPGWPKSEKEKLNDLADALTLLALS